MINFKKRQGMILIISLIIAVLIIMGVIYLSLTLTEKGMSKKDYQQKQAFWLAEAGIDRARNEAEGSWVSDAIGPFTVSGVGQYEVSRVKEAEGSQIITTFTSTGYFSSKANPKAQKTIVCKIKGKEYNIADFILSSQGSIELTGNATLTGNVLSAGSVTVGGSASVSGDKLESESFVAKFIDLFGKTEAQMESLATCDYTDPANSQAPVSGITWVDFASNTEFKITTTGWSGSGILIIDSGNLNITGGNFSGIIWVKAGTLTISGSPEIKGTIFVESGAQVTTIGAGTPKLIYDKSIIESTLADNLGAPFPSSIISIYEQIYWKDF